MDATALGIILGLAACGIHCSIRVWRRGSLDPFTIFTVSIAGFAIPTGARLIWAALSGDLGAMPQDWRVYTAAAGAVAILLSLNYLIDMLRGLFPPRATPSSTADKGAESPSSEH